MGRLEKELFSFISIFILSLTACVSAETPPTSTMATTKNIRHTPSPSSSPTSIPTLIPTPSCYTNTHGSIIYVLDDRVIFAWGVQGDDLDQALADNYPEWFSYKEALPFGGSEPSTIGDVIDEASFHETYSINPAVTLITMGVEREWESPSAGTVYNSAKLTAERLVRLWDEWANPDNQSIRDNYSDIANAGSYALFIYFDQDKYQLQLWCETYIDLFNQSPLNPP